ncbi:hypothetical protein [Arsukibacterium perlucidum]|uniref:hypothetical protein n=1 Tax=Arsukibacterium perlucidum TaxID=368811 RepID=UPI00035FCF8E|nr:hypothetical protein [Arsukibacterium perlucidum]
MSAINQQYAKAPIAAPTLKTGKPLSTETKDESGEDYLTDSDDFFDPDTPYYQDGVSDAIYSEDSEHESNQGHIAPSPFSGDDVTKKNKKRKRKSKDSWEGIPDEMDLDLPEEPE